MLTTLRFLLAVTPLVAYANASAGRQPRADIRQASPGACKAFPGTVGWPSDETWAQFNQSTGGKLLRAVPPGAVCHPEQPAYDADRCAAVVAGWGTFDFHQNDPVSNMWQQYNNDSCLPGFPDAPCSDSGYPAYVINATTAQDVKLSLDFARVHNVRVVVKSTGHDYQGRSQAPGALSIWVHHMHDLETLASFQPRGCNFTIDGTAVTAGGGSQVGYISDELRKVNQTFVGGYSQTVSLGGYITGGGHSILAPHYGLAADQVLEMEVVTPMGDIVVANECQNQDLFWAMRGGGGSTFGVATKFTLITYPTPPVIGLDMSILTPDVNASYVWDMAGYLLSQFPYLDSKGVSGYAMFTTNFTYPGFSVTGAGMGANFLIINTQDIQDMLAIWAPIVDHVNKTFPGMSINLIPAAFPSFQDWFSTHYDKSTAGYDEWVGSHLLDAGALTENTTAVSEAFKVLGDSQAFLVAGQGVKNAKPRGGGNSVNPSWRRTIAHATNGLPFPPFNHTAKVEALAEVNKRTEPMRQLSPSMGSYVNENNPAEPDFPRSFWGDNYERLFKIKREVDPLDVLWCDPCVGNDRWEEVEYQLCPRSSD
ncbi:FAD-binding domain-containing protein [Hypoxylon cercidicola]|nr:FAD-binding domain-containing protein [Hypoxylon cercidicola]